MGWLNRRDAGMTAAAKRARQRGRFQSCAFVLGVFLLPGLVIFGCVASAIYGRVLQRELDALEASIRAKGEPVTREELDAYLKHALESNPKAQKYLKPLGLLEVLPEEDPMERFFPLSIENYVSRGAFPDHELHSACGYLAVRGHVLDALKDGGDDTPGLGAGGDWAMVSSRQLRRFEELIWTKGFMALHDRDWGTFFEAQEQMLDFAEAFGGGDYPTPTVRHAMDLLKRAIITGEVPAEFYGQIADPYSRIDNQESLRWRVICDRVIRVNGLRDYYAGEAIEYYFEANLPLRTWVHRRIGRMPGYRYLTSDDTMRHLRFYTSVLGDQEKSWRLRYLSSIARQPYIRQYESVMEQGPTLPFPTRALNRIGSISYAQSSQVQWVRRSLSADGRIVTEPLALDDASQLLLNPESRADGHPIFEVYDPTIDYIWFEFRLRSVRLAMLIDAYRQKMGALPDSLDVLDPVAVAAIGGDPYVDRPLGYRVVEEGFLVYSVGRDLVDDGAEYKGFVMGDLVERFEKKNRGDLRSIGTTRSGHGGLTRPRAR